MNAQIRSMLGMALFALLINPVLAADGGPYFATGIKIGEVTPASAIAWTRLTRDAAHVPADAPVPRIVFHGPDGATADQPPNRRDPDWFPEVRYPDGATIETIAGAVPGADGEVRVRYKRSDDSVWSETAWTRVDPERDFTCALKLSGLQPASRYTLAVESRDLSGNTGATLEGGFRTARLDDDASKVLFTVTTGQEYNDQDAPGGGFKMYDAMLKLDPDFFVHTGDILYYDLTAKNEALARWNWQRMYSLPTNVNFHRLVASYFIKDDHDTWQNDCWPTMGGKFMGEFTFAQGQAIFLEQVPMSEKTYRTFRWGKDLQIWLVEGRDFRSANPDPDGPEKTIWGAEQKTWFKRTVADSDATFRVLISPTPIVGPDRENKNDNHANKGFAHEGRELRQFIAGQKNMIVICGDRHWQYVSVDNDTGLREYSCGPASDEHAGGWPPDERRPEHRYLNVIGGFLAVTVERVSGLPRMMLRHHGVDGNVLNEDRIEANGA